MEKTEDALLALPCQLCRLCVAVVSYFGVPFDRLCKSSGEEPPGQQRGVFLGERGFGRLGLPRFCCCVGC